MGFNFISLVMTMGLKPVPPTVTAVVANRARCTRAQVKGTFSPCQNSPGGECAGLGMSSWNRCCQTGELPAEIDQDENSIKRHHLSKQLKDKRYHLRNEKHLEEYISQSGNCNKWWTQDWNRANLITECIPTSLNYAILHCLAVKYQKIKGIFFMVSEWKSLP